MLTQLCDLLIAILSLGSLPGNGLLDMLAWRRTPLGHRKRRFHRLSRLTCLLILCLLWILLVSVRLAVQRTSRVAAEPAPDLAPASV